MPKRPTFNLRIFSTAPRWEKLAGKGARVQRLLWASTGTKNPLYPDTLYVDQLIGPNTVNTVPPATLDRFVDHGEVETTLSKGIEEAEDQLSQLEALDIDLNAVTQTLLNEGVEAFAKSFESLMTGISDKMDRLKAGKQDTVEYLGSFRSAVDENSKSGFGMKRSCIESGPMTIRSGRMIRRKSPTVLDGSTARM